MAIIQNGSLYWIKFKLFGHLLNLVRLTPSCIAYTLPMPLTYCSQMHHQASMPFVILFSLPRTFCPLSHVIWVTSAYQSKSTLEFKSSSYYSLCLPLSPHEQKSFFICIPVALYGLQTPPMLRLHLTQDLTQYFTYSRCSMWLLTLQIFLSVCHIVDTILNIDNTVVGKVDTIPTFTGLVA